MVPHRYIPIKSQRMLQPRLIWKLTMLYWALVFFVVALIAAILGFTSIAVAAASISEVLLVVFLILISLTRHLAGSSGRSY